MTLIIQMHILKKLNNMVNMVCFTVYTLLSTDQYLAVSSLQAGPCRDLWRGRCSKYKRGTWNTAFNRAVLLADMCIEMDASVLIQQQMP